jgi:hypothetical protein
VDAKDICFYVGDILYDETLQDIGILLERYDSHREYPNQPPSEVAVWRMWWTRAGESHYSEFGLQNLVDLNVFICYSNPLRLKLRDGV